MESTDNQTRVESKTDKTIKKDFNKTDQKNKITSVKPEKISKKKVSQLQEDKSTKSNKETLKTDSTEPNKNAKTRYSDIELQEFKELIITKLEDAKIEAKALQDLLKKTHDNGTDDTARAFKNLEECSDTQSKEELGQLASRQQKFIEQLEHALIRIETKCYGVCHISGKLIPKERLRIVPHTTQTIETKLISER